jgi:hypothetical protein
MFLENLSVLFSGSSSLRDVSGQPIRPIFRVQQSKTRFGETYSSHFQGPTVKNKFWDNLSVPFSGSSSPKEVFGQPIHPIFRVQQSKRRFGTIYPSFSVKQSKRRFGTTYPSHFQGPGVQETFRENLSVPFLVSSSPRNVSGKPIRPIFRVKQSKRRFETTYPSHFQV